MSNERLSDQLLKRMDEMKQDYQEIKAMLQELMEMIEACHGDLDNIEPNGAMRELAERVEALEGAVFD